MDRRHPEKPEESYTIRFTARKPSSIWSAVNIKRARALAVQGRMGPAGLKAFQARTENRSGIYSYEQRRDRLEEPYGSILRRNVDAWAFFQTQPSSYRKAAGWWVVGAKKEETRLKRLGRLIEDSSRGRRISQFTRPAPQTPQPRAQETSRGKSGSPARSKKGMS